MGEKKLHYKMYKDGKKFVFAAIATLSFFVFGGVSTVAVHADTTSGNSTAATVNSTSDTKSAAQSATTAASSASDTKSAAQSAATAVSSASDTKSAAQSAATAASSASDTNSFVQLMADNATAASNSTPIDDATSTGFSVSDPDYPSGMWIDPDKSHYSYEWLQAKEKGKHDGKQIVFSTNRTGDGIVYVTELSASNKVLQQYTLNQNTQVKSAVFDRTIYYNDVYFEMVQSSSNSFVTKYRASKFDNNYYGTLSYFVPKLITQTTYYVDKDGKQITDSNGNPVAAYTQRGLVGQNYTTSDVNVINGYYATAPANSNGVMSPFGVIGASYVKDFHNGTVVTYTQTGSDGTMSASIAQNGIVLKTWTSIKPSDPPITYQVGNILISIINPYIPQTSDIEYVYNKLGNWIVSNPDGSTTSIIYPNDPSNPTKIADSSVPGYPVIAFIPGYTPEDQMGTPLVPVDPDDRTKGYIPPTPSDNGTDTMITYTADKQKGSVSYVDDTTGKTLKTDSI
ncbi:transposase, partial [Limosilactobacillus fermentum]